MKTLYTLNVGPDGAGAYAPAVTALTYPLLRHYAQRVGADFHVIETRKYPDYPVVYEKLQIYHLARHRGDDWAIYVDADALVHPETIDFTEHLARDTVAHNGADMAAVRWRYDKYFRRDGRNIGSCNWFTIASNWCLDLWHPLEDLLLEEALANIQPTVGETTTVIEREHLIDDYVLSRNIARFGLKFTTLRQILTDVGLPEANFFHHLYTLTTEQKVEALRKALEDWNIAAWVKRRG